MIVSLHPHFKGDFGLTLSLKSLFEDQTASILKNATAIVVPQSIKQDEYAFCRECTNNVFPDYSHRFGFEGKAGNYLLLEKFSLPHPATYLLESIGDWKQRYSLNAPPPLPYPFVIKNDQGGCGFGIFLIKNHKDLEQALDFIQTQGGKFVLQEFVDHGGKDLRVVLIGSQVKTYWRCQEKTGEFRNNVGKGATIDLHGDPQLTALGIDAVMKLKQCSGINLAAVDVMFVRKTRKPLISEINFVFGRKGVGGTLAFRKLFDIAARNWLASIGLNQPI